MAVQRAAVIALLLDEEDEEERRRNRIWTRPWIKVYKHIIEQDTNMRECIKPEEMCCLTLRYLASGESFRSLEFQFRIGKRTISSIILEVYMTIIEELRIEYLTTPNTEDAWLDISKKFLLRWNFSNGIGAIDGKHIVIEQPSHSDSHYRNHKGTDSIV
ncbi:uncharacterized protein LOC130648520 [Hydractinia symbiolongicarpus]|uniref:uncharacterized protein LOC130648520 n=1 Tax=Hydractinia symbiolongicarpus TaxID=13093 RepID=UPI00254F2FFF|nr:uncharacterized protein LOC130648520 [Hydractinia symbiolongicarpus]